MTNNRKKKTKNITISPLFKADNKKKACLPLPAENDTCTFHTTNGAAHHNSGFWFSKFINFTFTFTLLLNSLN